MNKPEIKQKQIISARIFLGATDQTKLNSIKLITHHHTIWFLRRLSLVQSVATRRTRVEITCLREDLLALGIIHVCE